jgi:GTPase involved in cell partitioning and DNA repair
MSTTTKTDGEIIESRWIAGEGDHLLKCINRFQTLLKTLDAGDADNVANNCVTEDSEEYQLLLTELGLFDHAMAQAAVAARTNAREMHSYDAMQQRIEQSVTKSVAEIGELKTQLHDEQVARAHREEYEALTRLIQQYPSRAETEEKIRVLKAEMSTLDDAQTEATRRLDGRQKQFGLVFHVRNSDRLFSLQSLYRRLFDAICTSSVAIASHVLCSILTQIDLTARLTHVLY